MRDLDTAERLGIDVNRMIQVTHPDKVGRDGRPRVFTMSRLAFDKQHLADRGFVIGAQPNGQRDPRDVENEQLRARIAELEAGRPDTDPADPPTENDSDRDALIAEARGLGFNPRSNINTDRLRKMVEDARAKQAE